MTTDKVAQRRELAERLEAGFKQVQGSADFQQYLKTCARFHQYSIGNVMLIHVQRPDASRVAGFKTWHSLGRRVRKGERGIKILAPRTFKRRDDDEDDDTERVESVTYFVPVHVFDVSQTEGDELPSPTTELEGVDDAGLYSALERLAWGEGLTVDRTPGERSAANGFYSEDRRLIWVKPEASLAQATKTLAHELSHHYAEHKVNGHCRDESETIAEASAYVILAHFGIDSADYSFAYLASWTDEKTFKAKLDEIVGTAGKIIDALAA